MPPGNCATDFHHLVLTGFMGTGKSTLGALLAQKLELDFVDIDQEIEKQEGASIEDIFKTNGEPYFRQLEALFCQMIPQFKPCVIATGGGTLLSEQNYEFLDKGNLLVCLDCDPEVLWQRLEKSDQRPLINKGKKEMMLELLAQRQPHYNKVVHQIDVSAMNPEQISEKIINLWKNSHGNS